MSQNSTTHNWSEIQSCPTSLCIHSTWLKQNQTQHISANRQKCPTCISKPKEKGDNCLGKSHLVFVLLEEKNSIFVYAYHI